MIRPSTTAYRLSSSPTIGAAPAANSPRRSSTKPKRKYSLKYKKGDATETRSIESYLAKDLELAVKNQISDIEYAINNPDTVLVPSGIPLVDMIYDGDIAYAITPDKAASCWTWYEWPEKMPDGVWKQECLKFIQK